MTSKGTCGVQRGYKGESLAIKKLDKTKKITSQKFASPSPTFQIE